MTFDRTKDIGASEAAAVLGMSPWQKPSDIWARKVGLTAEQQDTNVLSFGRRAEVLVCDWYAERMGSVRLETSDTLPDPVGRPVFATPDRFVHDSNGGVATTWLVNAKTTSHASPDHGWGEPGTDQIPDQYCLQLAVEMACSGMQRADLAVLDLRERKLLVYHLQRDEQAEAIVMGALAQWWERHVVNREPPSDDGAIAAMRWPRDNGQMVQANIEGVFWMDALRRVTEQRKMLDAAEEECKDNLKRLIGPHKGVESHVGRVTWKAGKDGAEIDWEAVARECGATPDTIKRHTTKKPTSRRFVPHWRMEDYNE